MQFYHNAIKDYKYESNQYDSYLNFRNFGVQKKEKETKFTFNNFFKKIFKDDKK